MKDIKVRPRLRRGLLKDLSEVFDAADEMVGSGNPKYFDELRAHIKALKKEVFQLLREKAR